MCKCVQSGFFWFNFFMICRIHKRVSDNTDSPSCVCKALDTESIYVHDIAAALVEKENVSICQETYVLVSFIK